MSAAAGLLRCAEDQFLHGHLLSGRVVDYVDFEESLAVGSIAQEQLAHAALLIELAGLDVEGRDELVYERPLADWWPCALLAVDADDWPTTVVRSLLIGTAGMVWSGSIVDGADSAAAVAARVMRADQELHTAHWNTWMRLLAGARRTRDEIRDRCADLFPRARDMFGAAPGMPGPAGAQALHDAFIAELGDATAAVGLSPDLLGATPEPRRSGTDRAGIGAIVQTVRMLRVGRDDGVRGVYR